jgi:Fe-S oxidoreductase
MFCPAGFNMFTNVLPHKFGASFPFEVKFLGDWLWERIEQGRIERTNPVRMRVTIQDSCHSKQLGEDFRTLNRKIIEWTGAEIIEMPHHGTEARCCGLGAAGGWYPNVIPTLIRALREGDRVRAEGIVAYCNGCYFTLNIGRRFLPGVPIYHLLELVQLAIGEKPARRARARSGQILKAGARLFRSQASSLLRDRRRWVGGRPR